MTLAVDLGRKATKQTHNVIILKSMKNNCFFGQHFIKWFIHVQMCVIESHEQNLYNVIFKKYTAI